MRALAICVLVLGAFGFRALPAHADADSDPCEYWAAQQALPYLLQAYAITPAGAAGVGWAPLLFGPNTSPLGPGPIGPATLFSPPGLVPAYGPAGPGLTALALGSTAMLGANAAMGAAAAGQDLVTPPFLPGGLTNLVGRPTVDSAAGALTAPSNASGRQLLTLAHLQQAELTALNQRYTASGHAQLAAAFQRLSYAQAASSTFDAAKAACQSQRPAPADGAPPTDSGSTP